MRYYLTTAIDYVNSRPHLGTAYEKMTADLLPFYEKTGLLKRIDGVARTHFSRWGDGSAHFHLHFLARPAGMMQGRGPMLAFWDDVLPPVDDAMLAANARTVAAAMAEGGGEALVD